MREVVKVFLNKEGCAVRGDNLTTDSRVENIALHCLDFANGEEKWADRLDK